MPLDCCMFWNEHMSITRRALSQLTSQTQPNHFPNPCVRLEYLDIIVNWYPPGSPARNTKNKFCLEVWMSTIRPTSSKRKSHLQNLRSGFFHASKCVFSIGKISQQHFTYSPCGAFRRDTSVPGPPTQVVLRSTLPGGTWWSLCSKNVDLPSCQRFPPKKRVALITLAKLAQIKGVCWTLKIGDVPLGYQTKI